MEVISGDGAVGFAASLQFIEVPSVKRFGDPEMFIGSCEPAGVRRLRAAHGLGAGERFAAGAVPSSAAMFA